MVPPDARQRGPPLAVCLTEGLGAFQPQPGNSPLMLLFIRSESIGAALAVGTHRTGSAKRSERDDANEAQQTKTLKSCGS